MASSKVVFTPGVLSGQLDSLNPSGLGNPFAPIQPTGSNSTRAKFRQFIRLVRAAVAGQFIRCTLKAGTVQAKGTATLVSAVATNKVTINGKDVTCAQLNATGTLTASSIANNDTCTVNGITFTGKSSSPSADPNLGQFLCAVSNNADATALAAAINAHPSTKVRGVVTAKASSAVVTVAAVAPGTGGNAITITGGQASISASGATLANGAAASGDQWDPGLTDAAAAANLAAAINASSTALITGVVAATAASNVVTISAVCPGTCGNAIQLAKTGSPITLGSVTSGLITGGTDLNLTP